MPIHKPRFIWKGADRQYLRGLKKAIKAIQARDARETRKAAADGRPSPVLFANPSSGQATALTTLLNQVNTLLDAKG